METECVFQSRLQSTAEDQGLNSNGVWKLKRFCITCIEFYDFWLSGFCFQFFFNFDFHMHKTFVKSFVLGGFLLEATLFN